MITLFRKYTKKNAIQAILWIVLFSLVGGVFFMRIPSAKSADSIGTVNGYTIGKNDYVRRILQEYELFQKIREQLGDDADLFLKMQGYTQKPEEQVLETLINERLLQSASRNLGVVVSGDYKETKIVEPSFIVDSFNHLIPQQALFSPGSVSVKSLVQYLQRQGISDAEFDEAIDNTLQRLFMNDIIAGALYIPQSAIKEHYIRLYAKKKFALLGLSVEDYSKKIKAENPLVDDKLLEAFFNSHSTNYLIPEKRSGKLWTFNPADYGIVITDKEIQDYYVKHKKKFEINDKQKSKLSEKNGQAPKEVANKPKYKELSQVKKEIVKTLQEQKFNGLFDKDAARVVSQSHQMPSIVDNFIKDKKAVESPVEGLANDRSTKARKFFSLKPGGKSFYEEEGKGFIITLASLQKSFLPELATIKDRVLADYYKHLAEEAIKTDLQLMQEKIKGGMTLDAVAKLGKVPAEVSKTDWIDTQNPKTLKEFEDKKLPVHYISSLVVPHAILQELTESHGYLIQLLEVEAVDEDDFTKKKEKIVQSMHQLQTSYVQYSILQALKKQATITINPNLGELTRKLSRR